VVAVDGGTASVIRSAIGTRPAPARSTGPGSLARLRRFALDILRANQHKGATRGKIKRAAWGDALLLQLLAAA